MDMNSEPVATRSAPHEVKPDQFRWAAERKVELVLRLLKGESIVDLTRDVPADELEKWRLVFLESGTRALESVVHPADPYGQLRSVIARRGHR
jgi:hypothetical protein